MHQKTKHLAMAALCASLMVVGAYLKIPVPFLPVPFTTQAFFLYVTGLLLPPIYSVGAIAAYVLLGLAGFPVFSQGGGLQTVLTVNFGYLLGFIFSAFVIAVLHKIWRGKRFVFSYLLPAIAGVFAVYVVALPYAALLAALYQSKPIAFDTLMKAYFLSLMPLDLVKAAGAAAVARQVNRALRV